MFYFSVVANSVPSRCDEVGRKKKAEGVESHVNCSHGLSEGGCEPPNRFRTAP